MAKLTDNQIKIVLLYIVIFLVALVLGLIMAPKGHKGVGALLGSNLAVTLVGFLWLWKGESAWNQMPAPQPSPSPAPATMRR